MPLTSTPKPEESAKFAAENAAEGGVFSIIGETKDKAANVMKATYNTVVTTPMQAITSVAKNTKEGVANLLAIPYNIGVRAPVHAITRTTRAAVNLTFGSLWALGQKGSKTVENIVDWPVKKKNPEPGLQGT